ncbi:hypothetical protein BDM02DRAFT_3120218 [Thelephora ganbajun]|uniref:Uncharacterized protein n=1 Tax=Thelephora ganbajun TaxID=370292 RepID=A0ACB6Z7Z1_THEGA|nr:hypothetical protein BDM02DRAFT_3120218 [Thelephora ganbajun]
MSSEVVPSTLNLASNDLSKITKEDLVKYFAVLQGMYAKRRKKIYDEMQAKEGES